MKVLALAGGVGGAKLADGLAQILGADLTVIVNTGDDFEHLGLNISPDLDTVCYTLAGLANPVTGWGRVEDTWQAMKALTELGGPDWFNLGDRDLGTHLERTRRLKSGQPLSEITRYFCQVWGITPVVLPMTDDQVQTIVMSGDENIPFQEYFVRDKCNPQVSGFHFEGISTARPAPGVLSAIQAASLVIICPSNPWVSIDPILSFPSVREALEEKKLIAVSPIIGGKAVKGPVVKMYVEMGIEPSASSVAKHYGAILNGFVMDIIDQKLNEEIEKLGLDVLTTQTIMKSSEDRRRLAMEVLDFGEQLLSDTIEN